MVTWEKLMEYHRNMIEWMLAHLHSKFINNRGMDEFRLESMYAERHPRFARLVRRYGFTRIGCIVDTILVEKEYEHTKKILSCCERCPFFTEENLCCHQNSLYGTLREEGIKGPNAERVMKSILELKPREDIKDLYKLYIEY